MSELGTRLSPATNILQKLVEVSGKNIVEGGTFDFTPDLIDEMISKSNQSLNEIDAKFANLTKNVGLATTSVSSKLIAVAYASSLTKVANPAVDTNLVTVSFTTTGKSVLVVGLVSLRIVGSSPNNVRTFTKLKRDTTELDIRMNSFGTLDLGQDYPVFMLDYRATAAGTYTYKITGIKDTGSSAIYCNDSFAQEPSKIFVAELNF